MAERCVMCQQPATFRCARCIVLQLCSFACFVRHTPDCDAITRGRAMAMNAGLLLPISATGQAIPLQISDDEYVALFSPGDAVRQRYAATERRLYAIDATLSPADKVRYYCDVLTAYDSSSDAHQHKSVVHKMLLNRMYNAFDRDANARLLPHELEALTREQLRLGIGACFKKKN